jgi:AraC-like DNA-binding protein
VNAFVSIRSARRAGLYKLGIYAANAPHSTGSVGFRGFRPHPLLAELVEDIWDWSVPDAAAATNLMFRNPPSTNLLLVFHYREPAVSYRNFGSTNYQSPSSRQLAIKMESGIFTIRPTGPIGSVIVRLKPESAQLVMKAPMQAFMNTKVHLQNFFRASSIDLVHEALNEAVDSVARVGVIQDFLLKHVLPLQPNAVLTRAAALLRNDPSLQIARLAGELDVSARNLSRNFKAALGAGPKHFARVVRVEKAVEARRSGVAWINIAYQFGFADQAHLIRDFRTITGSTPEQAFRTPASIGASDDRVLNIPIFSG